MMVKNRSPPADRSAVTPHADLFCFSTQTRIRGFFVFCLHSGQAVALIIFILGLGTLLPWNFFITASQVSHLHAINHFLKIPVRVRYYFSTTKCNFTCDKKSNICDQSMTGLIYSWWGYRKLLNKVSSTPKSNICTLSSISIYPSSEFYLSSLQYKGM